jgi:Ser/Thr protein kinase RdoA (MazF antagonist)
MKTNEPAAPSLPIFRSVLAADGLLRSVLPRYDLGTSVTCYLLQRGINDIYLVESSAGKWILRISKTNNRTTDEVAAEIELLHILARGGLAVPVPIPRRDGARLNTIQSPEGERCAVLFRFVEGKLPDRLTPKQSACYGQMLARIHIVADTYAPHLTRCSHDRAFFIDEPLAQLTAFPPFAAHNAQLEFLWQTAEILWAEVEQLPHTLSTFGLCHGDLTRNNALFTSDDSLTVLDFEFCGYGWRAYDIATFIWCEIYDGFNFDWSQHDVFRSFVNGYQSVRPLSSAEQNTLRHFAALRQMFVFRTALQYAPGLGFSWMIHGWFDRSIEFIKACLSADWDIKVGLA